MSSPVAVVIEPVVALRFSAPARLIAFVGLPAEDRVPRFRVPPVPVASRAGPPVAVIELAASLLTGPALASFGPVAAWVVMSRLVRVNVPAPPPARLTAGWVADVAV